MHFFPLSIKILGAFYVERLIHTVVSNARFLVLVVAVSLRELRTLIEVMLTRQVRVPRALSLDASRLIFSSDGLLYVRDFDALRGSQVDKVAVRLVERSVLLLVEVVGGTSLHHLGICLSTLVIIAICSVDKSEDELLELVHVFALGTSGVDLCPRVIDPSLVLLRHWEVLSIGLQLPSGWPWL